MLTTVPGGGAGLSADVDTSRLEQELLDGYIQEQPLFLGSLTSSARFKWALGADVVALGLALSLGAVVVAAGNATLMTSVLPRALACLPVFLVVLGASRHRLRGRLSMTIAQQMREVALPLAAAALVCIAAWRIAAAASSTVGRTPEDALLLGCLLAVVTVSFLRRPAYQARPGSAVGRRVLVVGSGMVADRVSDRLRGDRGVDVVGFVDDDPKDPTGCLGSLEDLAAVCDREGIDHVVVAFTMAATEDLVHALRGIQGRLPISVVPRLFDVLPATADTHDLASGYPAMTVAPARFGRGQFVVKRLVDVVVATVALVLSLPVFAVAALGVRVSSPGPILLRHRRVGRNGQEFTVWKFRTFTVVESVPPADVLASGEQVAGPFPKLKNDPRATRFGSLLRRLSIDELPQLLNVLTGTMSLVGPRPVAPEFAFAFGPWALRRYAVKPGITGLWQVSGRNDLTYEEMCRLDHLYVTNWSLGLDLHILVRTARAVLGGQGCY